MITIRTGGTYVGPPYTPIPLPLLGDTGYSDVIFCPWCRDLYIQADVAGLGSGDEVDITIEGSLDGKSWDNLNATGLATTIDSNGCTILKFAGAVTPFVRVVVTGATGVLEEATVSIQAYMAIIS